ncbi:MAG: CbiX/SirB N-terminal domain-containing protein [Thiolinea sp.]
MDSDKKALLIVAHGSRRQRSNDAVAEVTAQVAKAAGGRYVKVDCAFLELAEPSIETGIDRCVAAGAGDIVVMPYFLSPGRHVAEDVPGIVQAKQQEYPELNIRLGTYLGAAPDMAGLILETVERDYCLCGKAQDECLAPACLQG